MEAQKWLDNVCFNSSLKDRFKNMEIGGDFQNTIEPLGFKIKITHNNRSLISKGEVSSTQRIYEVGGEA